MTQDQKNLLDEFGEELKKEQIQDLETRDERDWNSEAEFEDYFSSYENGAGIF